MNIATTLVIFFLTYYLITYAKLIIFKKEREEKKKANNKLTELRQVNYKTIDQQKAFLDAKFPKGEPWKFSWKWLGKFLLRAAIFIGTIMLLRYSWNRWINYDLHWWMAISFLIIFPILSNWVLKKFNLEGDDIMTYIK